ncbi:MAG: hypothetical protein ABXS93_08305 [Sulfurimonas sp.]
MATDNTQLVKVKEALTKYKAGDTSVTKDLLQSMKETSAWLTEKIQK